MTSTTPLTGGLARLNAMPAHEAETALRACLDVPRWVREVAGRRPYPSLASLRAAGSAAARSLDEDEIGQALAAHPRIGEAPRGADPAAGWSRREQAGVDPADDQLKAALAQGNRAYEERFGRVFLICASGLSGERLLAALQDRLANDPVTETRVVAEELRKIALVRLDRLVAPVSTEADARGGEQ